MTSRPRWLDERAMTDDIRVTGQPVVDEIRRRGGEASLVVTDVAQRSQVDQAVRHEDVTPQWWDILSRTAVWGSYFCAKAAYPHLAASRRGRLILISSPSGIEGSHNIPVYSPVQAAQRALVKSLAREWGSDHITVNAIAPVAVTGTHKQALAANPVYAERIQGRTALGQLGDEKDIAAVVACSPVTAPPTSPVRRSCVTAGGSWACEES
jgi:NAD(P)-dependent dehydrogenase (short-subunit alcohol dehydrogenase family)